MAGENLYTSRPLYNSGAGIGTGFVLGPDPHTFEGATKTLAEAEALRDTQSLDTIWLDIYSAEPTDTQPFLNIQLFWDDGTTNFVQWQVYVDGAWRDNSSSVGVRGPTGVQGVKGDASEVPGPIGPTGPSGDGNDSSFADIAAMNAYFSDETRYTKLTTNESVNVTEGTTVYTYRWIGETTPTSYDPSLMVRSDVGTTAGGLPMGPSSIESAAENLLFRTASGRTAYITQSLYDDTGSNKPTWADMGVPADVVIASVEADTLTAPFSQTGIIEGLSITSRFSIKPATFGLFVSETWLGTAAIGQPVISIRVDIQPEDLVDGVFEMEIPNPVTLEDGQEVYSEQSGIDLFGGLQTAGVYAGSIAQWSSIFIRLVDNVTLADSADVAAAARTIVSSPTDNTPGVLDAKLAPGAGIIFNNIGTASNVIIEVEATGDAGGDDVKVSADDTTPGFLDDKIIVGAGLSKSVINPGDNETLKIDIDVIASSEYVLQAKQVGTEAAKTTINAPGTFDPMPLDAELDPEGLLITSEYIIPKFGYYLISYSGYMQLGIGCTGKLTWGDGTNDIEIFAEQAVDGAAPIFGEMTKIVAMNVGAKLRSTFTVTGSNTCTAWGTDETSIYMAYLGAQLGGTDNDTVKISANDTTQGFLDTKVVAGDGIIINVLNEGGNESLEIVGQLGTTVDLGTTTTNNHVVVTNTDGSDATIAKASTTQAGVMDKAMFDKLGTIAEGAGVNIQPDLTITAHEDEVAVAISSGTGAIMYPVDSTNAGVMLPSQFDKLAALPANAEVNDGKVKVRLTDTTPGFLYGAINVGPGLSKSVTSPLGDEILQIDLDAGPGPGSDYLFSGNIATTTISDTGNLVVNELLDPENMLSGGVLTVPQSGYWLMSIGIDASVDPAESTEIRLGTSSNYITLSIDTSSDGTMTSVGILSLTSGNVIQVDVIVLSGFIDLTPANSLVTMYYLGSTGGGGGADESVKVSANDTTVGFLDSKMSAGTGISLSVLNDGANESLQVNASANLATTTTVNHVVVTNTIGNNATIAKASASQSGVMDSAMFDKLSGVEPLANVNDGLISAFNGDTGFGNLESKVVGSQSISVNPITDGTDKFLQIEVLDSGLDNLTGMTISGGTGNIIGTFDAGGKVIQIPQSKIVNEISERPYYIESLAGAGTENWYGKGGQQFSETPDPLVFSAANSGALKSIGLQQPFDSPSSGDNIDVTITIALQSDPGTPIGVGVVTDWQSLPCDAEIFTPPVAMVKNTQYSVTVSMSSGQADYPWSIGQNDISGGTDVLQGIINIGPSGEVKEEIALLKDVSQIFQARIPNMRWYAAGPTIRPVTMMVDVPSGWNGTDTFTVPAGMSGWWELSMFAGFRNATGKSLNMWWGVKATASKNVRIINEDTSVYNTLGVNGLCLLSEGDELQVTTELSATGDNDTSISGNIGTSAFTARFVYAP